MNGITIDKVTTVQLLSIIVFPAETPHEICIFDVEQCGSHRRKHPPTNIQQNDFRVADCLCRFRGGASSLRESIDKIGCVD